MHLTEKRIPSGMTDKNSKVNGNNQQLQNRQLQNQQLQNQQLRNRQLQNKQPQRQGILVSLQEGGAWWAVGWEGSIEMRAIQILRTGGPEVLELVELSVPVPSAGQVLIKVAATGVNFIETYFREGQVQGSAAADAGLGSFGCCSRAWVRELTGLRSEIMLRRQR